MTTKTEAKKMFEDFFGLQLAIHQYFGYVEDWRAIPLEDNTDEYWQIVGGEGRGGVVRYGGSPTNLDVEDSIYTQRFLPKWVYRAQDFTLVCSDPHSDMNYFLRIFDNAKEVK